MRLELDKSGYLRQVSTTDSNGGGTLPPDQAPLTESKPSTNATKTIAASTTTTKSSTTTATTTATTSTSQTSGLHVTEKSEVKPKSSPRPAGVTRRAHPRRHTLSESSTQTTVNNEDSQKKREAFMDLLAKRYPHYSEKIKDTVSEDSFPIRTPRQRDERRRTAVVTYNPSLNRSVEYDENGTMSDIDTATAGNFQRGHQLRSSLPIVRSSSSTFERPLASWRKHAHKGLVFLVYKDETKKAALPNEITTLDTVRALFVRSFPDKVTMQYMESPKNKIYIVDPRTNIYYQLEDLRDIKDRTVLKVHECDSDQQQVVKQRPEVRGKTIVPPAQTRTLPTNMPVTESPHQQSAGKSKSLPSQNSAAYQQMINDNQSSRMTERPRSTTPTMDARGQAGIIPRQVANRRYSPERQATPDRPPLLGTIPENRQLLHGRNTQNGYTISPEISPIPVPGYNTGYWPVDHPYQHPGFQRGYQYPSVNPANPMYAPPLAEQGVNYMHYPGSSLAQPPLAHPQTYMVKSSRTPSIMTTQRSTPLLNPVDMRDGSKVISPNRHSLTFAPMTPIPGSVPLESTPVNPMQRSQSYRVSTEREPILEQVRSLTPQPSHDPETKVRMERMEAQLANLTAWVHNTVISPQHEPSSKASSMRSSSSTVSDSTYTGSAASSLSDIPSAAQHGYQGMVPSQQKPQSPMCSNPNKPPVFGPNTRTRMILIKRRIEELKSDFKNMQLLHQKNTEAGHAMFLDSAKKIMSVLNRVSFTVSIQPVRKQRHDVDSDYNNFVREEQRIDNELSKLENSVEEVRTDVISKQCRVNSTDVEKMALTLSQLSKCIAEQKSRFPGLTERMKSIMSAEMDIVVQEEQFLKDHPERLDTALKRCKKLTGTLFTLKRLALVQERNLSSTPTKTTPKVLTTALHQSPSPLWPSQEAVANSDQSKSEQASIGPLAPIPGQYNQATHNLLPTNGMPPHGNSNAGGDGDETSLSNCISDKTAKEPGESRMTQLPSSAEVQTVEVGEVKKKAFPLQHTKTLSFTSNPNVNGNNHNIVTKPIAKKADITKSLPSNHNFVMSAKKVTGSHDKSHASVLSSVANTTSKNSTNIANNADNTKASLLALASNKNSARADFFSNMLPSQGYQVVNSTQPSTPTTTLDYTVRISPIRTTLFTNPTSTSATSTTRSNRKPSMSTAVAVAEIRPKQPPPPTLKKPSHLWKGNNNNKQSAIVSEPQTPTAFSPIHSLSNSSSLSQISLSKSPPSSPVIQQTGSKKGLNRVPSIKKVPPPPPPRKSSKHSGIAAASATDSPVSSKGQKSSGSREEATVKAAKNSSPQFVQYTITTHQSKPSMLHLQKNIAPAYENLVSINTAYGINHDNSPSKESADSTESFSSSGSQQSVIQKDMHMKQNGINTGRKTRPDPPQRTTSQLTNSITDESVLPVDTNSTTQLNGINKTLSVKGEKVQETDID